MYQNNRIIRRIAVDSCPLCSSKVHSDFFDRLQPSVQTKQQVKSRESSTAEERSGNPDSQLSCSNLVRKNNRYILLLFTHSMDFFSTIPILFALQNLRCKQHQSTIVVKYSPSRNNEASSYCKTIQSPLEEVSHLEIETPKFTPLQLVSNGGFCETNNQQDVNYRAPVNMESFESSPGVHEDQKDLAEWLEYKMKFNLISKGGNVGSTDEESINILKRSSKQRFAILKVVGILRSGKYWQNNLPNNSSVPKCPKIIIVSRFWENLYLLGEFLQLKFGIKCSHFYPKVN